MKPNLPTSILCGGASVFVAFYCVAQKDDEDQAIKGPQFPPTFIVPNSSVSPHGRSEVLAPADWDHFDETGKHGKWSFHPLVLLKIDNGEVKWQRHLLTQMQQGIH